MPAFDPSSDHGEVYGIPGVKWDQGGVLFNLHGEPVVLIDGAARALAPAEIEDAPESVAEVPEPSPGDMPMKELRAFARIYNIDGAEKMDRAALLRAIEAA